MYNVTSVKEAGAIVAALEDIKNAMEGGYPEPTSASEGQVLTADGDGGASWEDAQGGLPDISQADVGDVLAKGFNGDPEWAYIPDLLPNGSAALVPSTAGVTNGYVLTNNNGTPAWAAASGGGGGSTIYSAFTQIHEDEKSGSYYAYISDPNVSDSTTRVLSIYRENGGQYYPVSDGYAVQVNYGNIYIQFTTVPSTSYIEVYYTNPTEVMQP